MRKNNDDDDHETPKKRRTVVPRTLPAELHPEQCLDPRQAGLFLGFAPITLAQWRTRGEGPPYVKLGHAVRYRVRDVIAWRDAHLIGDRGQSTHRTMPR